MIMPTPEEILDEALAGAISMLTRPCWCSKVDPSILKESLEMRGIDKCSECAGSRSIAPSVGLISAMSAQITIGCVARAIDDNDFDAARRAAAWAMKIQNDCLLAEVAEAGSVEAYGEKVREIFEKMDKPREQLSGSLTEEEIANLLGKTNP